MSLAIHSRNGHKRFLSHNRNVTPEEKASRVAASILSNGLDITQVSTWQRYGIDTNPVQIALVLAVLKEGN